MDVQDVSRLLDYTSEMERGEDLERKDTISTRSKVRIYDVFRNSLVLPFFEREKKRGRWLDRGRRRRPFPAARLEEEGQRWRDRLQCLLGD